MSYDIRMVDPVTHEEVELETAHMMQGGTYALGGTRRAWLNVTYNYSQWYNEDGVFPSFPDDRFYDGRSGIRSIYGMSGADAIPVLEHAVTAIEGMEGDIPEEERKHYEESGTTGYWMPTKANALKPLHQLLALAKMRPDAIFEGD